MATTTQVETPEVYPLNLHLRWSGIFAGLFVTLGVWILLYALGLAAGLSALDANNPGAARAAGIGTGVWSVLVPILALFCGGLVCTRSAPVVDRVSAGLQGLVLWGFATVVGVLVIGMVVSSLVSGVVKAGSAVAGAAGSAVSSMDATTLKTALGVDANDLLGPVNQRLRDQGKPTITASQLQNAAQDALHNALQQGRLDREMLVGALVRETRLSRDDVQDLAARVESQYDRTRASASSAMQSVKTGAIQAADTTGKALWGVFFSLLLALGACVAGALLGAGSRARVPSELTVPPLARRGEVYP